MNRTHSDHVKTGTITRRHVLGGAAAVTTLALAPLRLRVGQVTPKPVRFGIITDVHQDVMHDGEQRLRAFVDEMRREDVEFIVQNGDFCVPIPRNQTFLEIFNSFEKPRYHVLGNHDMDGDNRKGGGAYKFTREQTMSFWGMSARYYSFDHGSIYFIVLDGNDQGPRYSKTLMPD